jgi:hypothetical protein
MTNITCCFMSCLFLIMWWMFYSYEWIFHTLNIKSVLPSEMQKVVFKHHHLEQGLAHCQYCKGIYYNWWNLLCYGPPSLQSII